jgi:hypothetical protein
MIRIRRWKYSQSRDHPNPAVISLGIELDLSFDIRNRNDTWLIKSLSEVLLAIREKKSYHP